MEASLESENNIVIRNENDLEIATTEDSTAAQKTSDKITTPKYNKTSGDLSIDSRIIAPENGIECLESIVRVTENFELLDIPNSETSQNANVEIDKLAVKMNLLGSKSVLIIADVSDGAQDYIQSISKGIEMFFTKLFEVAPEITPNLFVWNNYFQHKLLKPNDTFLTYNENLNVIRSMQAGGKCDYSMLFSCLSDTIENSISAFSIIIISASSDNVNTPETIFEGLENLRRAVNKQHVDFHCIGVGNQHDMIMLDNITRMSTGRGTYQYAHNAESHICGLYHEFAVPSVRIEAELTSDSDSGPVKKLYKMQVDRAVQTVTVDGKNKQVHTKFTSRLFGKLTNKKSIKILIAGGELQKIGDYTVENLHRNINEEEIATLTVKKTSSSVEDFMIVCSRIKLQLDAITNCLKYAMTEKILHDFRNEIQGHYDELSSALKELVPKFGELDLYKLRFLNDIIVYCDTVKKHFGKPLTKMRIIGEEYKGIIDVSMDDFANLVAKSFACDMKSIKSINDKVLSDLNELDAELHPEQKCITYRTSSTRKYPHVEDEAHSVRLFVSNVNIDAPVSMKAFIRERLFPELMALVGVNTNNSLIFPIMSENVDRASMLCAKKIIFGYFMGSSRVPQTSFAFDPHEFEHINITLQICSLLGSSYSLEALKMLAVITNELNDISGFLEMKEKFMLSIAQCPFSEIEECVGSFEFSKNINAVGGFAQTLRIGNEYIDKTYDNFTVKLIIRKIISGLAKIAHKRALRRSIGGNSAQTVNENLFSAMKVKEEFYEGYIAHAKKSAEKLTTKNLELKVQSQIIEKLKDAKIKVIKPSGKRKVIVEGAALHEDKTPIANKQISEVDLERYISAFRKFTKCEIAHADNKETLDEHVVSAKYKSKYEQEYDTESDGENKITRSLITLSMQMHNLLELHPQAFGTDISHLKELFKNVVTHKNAISANNFLVAISKSIIQEYVDLEKKKILRTKGEQDRNEYIMGFVTTQRIYAAAGFLHGAFLGVNLSKYLGTLCEAVKDKKIEVPLLHEKLAMIISGKLIVDAKTGKALVKRVPNTSTDAFIELVEDIGLNKTQDALVGAIVKRNYDWFGKLPADWRNMNRKELDALKHKLSLDDLSQVEPYWRVGWKKYKLIVQMLGSALSEEVKSELFPHWI